MAKSITFMTFNGKGGVGKSLVAALTAQTLLKTNAVKNGQYKLKCFDIDPRNPTFTAFKRLNVKHNALRSNHDDNKVDMEKIGQIMEQIVTPNEDVVNVIDIGSGSYGPLFSYMTGADVTEVLRELGHEIYFQIIIAGGQSYTETSNDLLRFKENLPNDLVSVWINNYFGGVSLNTPSGSKTENFLESALYQQCEDQVHSVVNLPPFDPETYGKDLEAMLSAGLTFEEVQGQEEIPIFSRNRLKKMERSFMEATTAILPHALDTPPTAPLAKDEEA
jgi:hypothetical protein